MRLNNILPQFAIGIHIGRQVSKTATHSRKCDRLERSIVTDMTKITTGAVHNT